MLRVVAIAVLVLVQAASMPAMLRRPMSAMAISLACGVGFEALWPQVGVLGLANVSICALATMRPPRESLRALAVMVLLAAWPATVHGALAGVVAVGGPVLSWSWGELLRTRQARRGADARRAAAEERMRIARELHDVIAHTVSLIVVQSVAAQDVFERRPEQSRTALATIERSARDALGELRALLDGSVDGDGAADGRRPQPGVARLPELVRSVRGAGLDVVLASEGEPVTPSAQVDLSAFRIVQEALTNALRHAHAERATVTVRYASDALELEIVDDGRGGRVDGGGHGIAGMRERVALAGGSLDLSPPAEGGFRVHARLPLRDRRR